jgi:hypothetical protein
VLCVGAAQAQGGQPLVEDLWWDGRAFPPRSYLLWTSPAVPSYAGDDRQSSKLYDEYCCVQYCEHGLGIFKCLSDSHVVCHSAIAGKIPGEAMASALRFHSGEVESEPAEEAAGSGGYDYM